jgi:predicted lactoylglutathione lyase
MRFFEALGFGFNPQFTDATAACMVIDDQHIFAMLLTHEKFRGFAPTPSPTPARAPRAGVPLDASRAEVDDYVRKAVAAGGTTFRAPGGPRLHVRSRLPDLDGHVWELVWMDPSAVQRG